MKKFNDQVQPSTCLTVSERVRAAILLLKDSRAQQISVSEICRAAGVNRANLYARHRDLVDEILKCSRDSQATRDTVRRARRRQRSKDLAERLTESEVKYRALLIVCIEQQAEIVALRVRLDQSLKENARTRSRT